MIIEDYVYSTFGLFYKQGHVLSQNMSDLLQSTMDFIDIRLLASILLLQIVIFVIHTLLYFLFYRIKHMARNIRYILLTYSLITLFFIPVRVEEQKMSLLVTIDSFLSSKANNIVANQSLLDDVLAGHLADFKTKKVAPLDLPDNKKYNLVVYSMESTRAVSTSAYGGPSGTTPFLNNIKDSGLFFDQCYTNGVRSIKALTTMLLGVYPYNALSSWSLRPVHIALKEKHLSAILQKNNYFTSFFVNSHISFDDRNRFLKNLELDHFEGTKTFISIDDSILVEKMNKQFELAESSNKLLCTFLLSSSAHAPYPYQGEHVTMADTLANADKLGTKNIELYQRYLNTIRHQDDVAAQLYESLKKTGRLKNTVFVVVGDHGESFGEHGLLGGFGMHGASLFQESIHVPLWIYHPDLPPRKIEQPVQFLDFIPTWLAMLNIETDTSFLGRNVLVEPRERLFITNHIKRPVKCIIEFPYKLIKYDAYKNNDTVSYQLFNLLNDPSRKKRLGHLSPGI